MNALLVLNTVSAGFCFMIWSKDGLINVAMKGLYLALLIANVVALAKG